MTDCTRTFFLADGKLTSVDTFEICFGKPEKYIYEVFRSQQGIPLFIEDHLNRLWKTAALEHVSLPYSEKELLHDILQLIDANPGGDGNIKIVIQHGERQRMSTLIYFTPHQYPTAEQYKNGVPVSLFFAERHNPNAKVMDVSLRAATDRVKATGEVYEVLLVDRDGFITEGSRSNVFFIRNNTLITPPLDTVLEGITRLHIMQLCATQGIPVIEQTVHHSVIGNFDALFISGTSRRVLPVNRIDDKPFATKHPLLSYLQQLFEKHVADYLAGFQRSV